MMQLSKRLQRIADFVRDGDRLIDVGTDHAYIPIWLLLNGKVSQAAATDIRSGPLERARIDAAYYGVSDRLRLAQCDGLARFGPEDADTVIIAGMGGETIIGILEAAPWVRQKRLILQPQTKQAELRAYLSSRHCAITDAALVYDAGRIYLVWLVAAGEMPPWCAVDAALLQHRDPLLRPYLDDRMKRLRKRLHGLEAAARRDDETLSILREELSQLETIYHEVSLWQT